MSLSLSLLTIFSKEICFGSDTKAFVERSQVLSIIYLNISIFIMNTGYEIAAWFLLRPSNYSVMLTFVTFPCVILCFVCLKIGKKEMSAAILLLYMHFTNIFASYVMEIPMAALYALMIYPSFSFFLTSSNKIYLMNITLCIANLVYHVYKTQQIFGDTLHGNQATQIHTFIIGAVIAFIIHYSTSYIQKGIEKNVWKMAQSHHDKNKALMIDILKAVKAKDEYAEYLSGLILYPVNVINQTLTKILEQQNDPDQLQLLKNAKLTTSILLNLLNNSFNLPKVKLEVEKLELEFSNMDVLSTIQRALMLNNTNLKRNNNSVRVFVNENLPSMTWTDPSLYLTMFNGHIFEATRNIQEDTKIHLAVNLEHENQAKDALLTPDEDYIVRHKSTQTHNQAETKARPSVIRSNSEIQDYSTSSDSYIGELSLEDHTNDSRNKIRTNVFQKKWSLEKSTMSQGERWEIFRFGEKKKTSSELPSSSQRGYLKVQCSYIETDKGLKQEEIAKLIDSDDGNKTTHLGLWISKHMCLKLGGDMRVYNHPDRAITCVFYIPVNTNHKPASLKKDILVPREKVSALILDGYASTRDLYKLQLERKGVMVAAAATSREALDKFKIRDEQYFDFVIIDIQTLETSGFDVVKAIREWEAMQERKKVDIYITSNEFDNEEETLIQLRKKTGGVKSTEGIKCLIKPITFEMISNLTNKYSRDHNKRTQGQENKSNIENQTRCLTSEDLGVRLRKNL